MADTSLGNLKRINGAGATHKVSGFRGATLPPPIRVDFCCAGLDVGSYVSTNLVTNGSDHPRFRRLKGARRSREVARIRRPGYVGIAGSIHGEPRAIFVTGPAEVGVGRRGRCRWR